MESKFAQYERVSDEKLASEIEIVNKNPVISGLLYAISGLICILDENRQIVALNDSFFQILGIDDPAEALGLRLGEALQCIHAYDEPAGCGTTKYCSSCGAAVAIMSSLEGKKPVELICALSAKKDDKIIDLALLVKSHPIIVNHKRFLLIFFQDITQQQQRAALERTFFHDINNMLNILLGTSELLVEESPSKLAKSIHQASLRLHKEIAIQRCLSQSKTSSYLPMRNEIKTEVIFEELKAIFENHPVIRNKNLEFHENYPNVSFITDFSLLSRVLSNMTINALEATEDNGIVKIWIEHESRQLIFCVWNAQEIPAEIALRIFQRNFSTKEQAGRGIGTFSMKLFGEEILGGKVSFTTSRTEGTVFRFAHPI